MAGQQDKSGQLDPAMALGIAGCVVFVVALIFPVVFAVPVIGAEYGAAWLMQWSPWFGYADILYQLDEAIASHGGFIKLCSSDEMTIQRIAQSFNQFPMLPVVVFAVPIAALAKRKRAKIAKGRNGEGFKLNAQYLIEYMAPYFPHLYPLINVNPLDTPLRDPSMTNYMRIADNPIDWAIKHDLIPACKCGAPMYDWHPFDDSGTPIESEFIYSCEESFRKLDENGCRHKQKTAPMHFNLHGKGFDVDKCELLFAEQLKYLGRFDGVKTIKKLGKAKSKTKKIVYILFVIHIVAMYSKEKARWLNGELAKSFVDVEKGTCKAIIDDAKLASAVKEATKLFNKHIKDACTVEFFNQVMNNHAYVTSALYALRSIISATLIESSVFYYIKWHDRRLHSLLSQVGRASVFVESVGIYEHARIEKVKKRKFVSPMVSIYTKNFQKMMGYGKYNHSDG